MTLSEARECLAKGCTVRRTSTPDVYLVPNNATKVLALENVHNEAVKNIITKAGLDKAVVAPNVTAVVVTESEVILSAFVPSDAEFWADDYECVDCVCKEATEVAPEAEVATEAETTDVTSESTSTEEISPAEV